MSPEPHEKNGTKANKTEEKKTRKMNPILLYGIGFFASFGIVLASTFFYVTKVQQPKMAEDYLAMQSASAESDSIEASLNRAGYDTTQAMAKQDTTDYLNDREKEYRELERMRLVEQVSILRDRLEQSQLALAELSDVSEINDSLFNEFNTLKKEYDEANDELEFLKETLPGNMDKLMETIKEAAQTNNTNTGSGTMAGGQQPQLQQQEEDEDQGKGLRKLAKIYGNMKAKEASAIMENMTDKEIVDIMIRMRDRDAAAILTAFTDKTRAAKISRRMQSE